MFSVYSHTNKETGKVYVGITSQDVNKRWNEGKGYKGNRKFYSDISKCGWDAFDHKVIAEGLTEEQAIAIEKELISAYDSTDRGYNISDGGKYVKNGLLSHNANELKNGMKLRMNSLPELGRWYEYFENANNGKPKGEALWLNDIVEGILNGEQITAHWPTWQFTDPIFLASVIYELRYCFAIDQYAQGKRKEPRYISMSDRMELVYIHKTTMEGIDW